MTTRRFIVDSTLFPDIRIEQEYLVGSEVSIELADVRDAAALATQAHGAEGLVLGLSPFRADHFRSLAQTLKVIGRPGVGLDNIDFDAARWHGVGVINCPDYCTEEVASHALALILALARRLPASDELARRNWNEWHRIGAIAALSEVTVGIVGYGRSGRLLASYLKPLVRRVLVVDPNVQDVSVGERVDSLDLLLAESDITSLHVPLNDQTKNLFSADRIARLKPGAAVVNVSRGGLIDEVALTAALVAGHVSAAALDVLSQEPPEGTEAILSAPNVLLTPHTAWYSTRSETRVRIDVLEAMLAYISERDVTTASIVLDGRPVHSGHRTTLSDIRTTEPG